MDLKLNRIPVHLGEAFLDVCVDIDDVPIHEFSADSRGYMNSASY